MSWIRRIAVAGMLAPLALPVAGQSAERLPADLEEVGVTERLDHEIPLGLRFTDSNGRSVKLEQFFAAGRPVVLTLVYYECPMLCTLVLGGVVDVLQQTDWVPGRQFELVTVSIDPGESTPLARLKKQNYIEDYGKPEAAAGWHFLTGNAQSIRELADAVGFRYRYLEDENEYAHPAVLVLLTPDGRISRYLFGIRHDPRTLRLSLVEASEGRVGSAVDKFLLYCYRYDADKGNYAPVALKIMRIGGVAMMLVLGAALLTFWLREHREKRLA